MESEIDKLWEKLNPKQRDFVTAWAKLGFHPMKQSQAFRDAGLDEGHTNPASTRTEAWRMLTNADVSAVVAAILRSSHPTPEQIIERRKQLAFSDIGDILDETGHVSLALAVERGKTHLIRGLHQRYNKEGKLEIKVDLHDSQTALAALERIAGMDKGTMTVEAGDKLAELLSGMVAPWADGAQDVDNT